MPAPVSISFTNRYRRTISVTARGNGKVTLKFPSKEFKLSKSTAQNLASALLAMSIAS